MDKARVTRTVSVHGNGGKPEARRRGMRKFSVAGPCEYLNLKLPGTATHSTGAITATEEAHTVRIQLTGDYVSRRDRSGSSGEDLNQISCWG
jgi:hypothetical protein